MRLWTARDWSTEGYRLAAFGPVGEPIATVVSVGPAGEELLTSRTFPHSFAALIGSLCDAGFALRRLAEDRGGDPTAPVGTEEHLAAVVPPFFRMLARKVIPRPAAAHVRPPSQRSGRLEHSNWTST
jgi:hypothetical protein